ncbi:hypothetical protein [Myxococcus landrumensis]|uniref:Molecular chaperone DnaJ n=1 Tax=Myxococcus landrumensis TaxID=2813577 RepID=A0ABX7N5M1_9BACT|nr:hypothetical protein [Myxococcus landrumus]QSQ14082.1 hypothetical protein JY572_38170 [Myxococcus landrumus]
MSTQAPPVRVEPPDWWNLIAHQRGCHPAWRWLTVETIDHTVPRDQAHCLVSGGVYSTLVKSGPRKGKPNYGKPDPGTERRLVISFVELDACKAQWEAETGKCSKCGGSGEEGAGWSKEGGSRYRTCTRCNGSGKAVTP